MVGRASRLGDSTSLRSRVESAGMNSARGQATITHQEHVGRIRNVTQPDTPTLVARVATPDHPTTVHFFGRGLVEIVPVATPPELLGKLDHAPGRPARLVGRLPSEAVGGRDIHELGVWRMDGTRGSTGKKRTDSANGIGRPEIENLEVTSSMTPSSRADDGRSDEADEATEPIERRAGCALVSLRGGGLQLRHDVVRGFDQDGVRGRSVDARHPRAIPQLASQVFEAIVLDQRPIRLMDLLEVPA